MKTSRKNFMKKIIAVCLVLTMAFSMTIIGNTDVYAKAKKIKYTKIATVKKVKIYSANKALWTKTKKGNYKKISKNTVNDYFGAFGNYIYYATKGNKLCRVKYNGKNFKKYNTYARNIKMIKDGYIYYSHYSGLHRIAIKGGEKQKLLTYTQTGTAVICGDRIFYSTYVKDENKYIIGAKLCSKKLDGTDNKEHYIFDRAEFKMDCDDRYVFIAEGNDQRVQIRVIDITDETLEVKKIYREENDNSNVIGYISLGAKKNQWYYATEKNICVIDYKGTQKILINIENKYDLEHGIVFKQYKDYYLVLDSFRADVYNKDGVTVKCVLAKNGAKVVGAEIQGKKLTVQLKKNRKVTSKTYNL